METRPLGGACAAALLVSAANCCVASTSEVEREIPELGSQADGDLRDLGQACISLPASLPRC